MTKNRVYSHEDRTSEKCKTSSFLFLRSHFSFLMIVCILLKKVRVSWEAPPTKKFAAHRNLSIDLHYISEICAYLERN